MANRRMFAKTIVESGRFLRLPVVSQCLYFHLGVNADDDGIVEAYPSMTLLKATDKDLKVLASEGFVQILNDDLLVAITDWTVNNKIRRDRYQRSIYHDLLEPKADEAIPRARQPDGSPPETGWQPDDNQMTTKRQPDGNQMATNVQPSIGKDRLGKVKLGQDTYTQPGEVDLSGIPLPLICQQVKNDYNEICVDLPKVTQFTTMREQAVADMITKCGYTRETFKDLFKACESSAYLTGHSKSGWRASFDWLMKESNAARVLEGTYEDRRPQETDIEDDVFARAARGEQI